MEDSPPAQRFEVCDAPPVVCGNVSDIQFAGMMPLTLPYQSNVSGYGLRPNRPRPVPPGLPASPATAPFCGNVNLFGCLVIPAGATKYRVVYKYSNDGGGTFSPETPFTLPSVALSDLALLVAGAVGIAVVSLTDTISTASAFAARAGREVDGDREMIGIGAANIAAGFFQGFPVSTSGSRTAVAEQSGAKSQVTGLVGALAITLMLLVAPGLLRNLPQPTLAAVVIAASLSLADIPGTVRLWQQRRAEFTLSMAAFAGVALLGVLPGIAIAVALSIGNVFRRAWWPYQTVLGRAPGIPGYHDVRSYPDAEQLPGCVLYRFDAPLFFANCRTFRDQIRRLSRSEPPPVWIVVAAEPITDVDTTAADMLEDLDEALNAEGISLVFAEMKDPVREKIGRYELTRTIDPAHFFPTVGAAVAAFREQFGADWTPAPGTQAR